MKLTNLGGATGILEHKGKRILFDPWLDEGIFHGAWHHYPPLNLPKGISSLGQFDYIYISHIHEDHCSLKTLQQLNTDAELIIADRTPNFVLNFLRKNNLCFERIHLVPPWTPTQINSDFEVSIVTADPAHELNYLIDSGLVIKWDENVVYNSNDCAPYAGSIEFILETYKHVDLALLPYATGSSFPSCFTNLDHQEKLAEKSRLFKVGIQKFVNTLDAIKPSYAMPFADQYVIVGSRQELNIFMPHPSSPGVVRDHFHDTEQTKLVLLNSGQSFDLETARTLPDVPFIHHTDEQKLAYAAEFKNVKYDFEKIELSKTVNIFSLLKLSTDNYFARLNSMEFKTKTKFIVEVSDWKRKFVIDNDSYNLSEISYDETDTQPFLKVSVSASLLVFLLLGHISWNIADAALFIEYTRLPNAYDPKVHSLWNYLKI